MVETIDRTNNDPSNYDSGSSTSFTYSWPLSSELTHATIPTVAYGVIERLDLAGDVPYYTVSICLSLDKK